MTLQGEVFSTTDQEVFTWTGQNSGVVLDHKRLLWCLSGLWGIENKSTGIAGITDDLSILNEYFKQSKSLTSCCYALGFDEKDSGLANDTEKQMFVMIQRHFKLSQNIEYFYGKCHLPIVVSAHVFEELNK